MPLSNQLEKASTSIIHIHRVLFEDSPTPMKLQKLCYYAQGYALAEGRQWFDEDFQAWQHGPVIPELYTEYKHFQWKQISNEIKPENIEEDIFLTDIVSAYGRYDGAALSTMTHRESPWIDARGDIDESLGSDATIPKDSIKKYFESKLKGNAQ